MISMPATNYKLPHAISRPTNAGEDVIPVINQLRRSFVWDAVVVTFDWHPPGHVSFASAHGREPFSGQVELQYTERSQLC